MNTSHTLVSLSDAEWELTEALRVIAAGSWPMSIGPREYADQVLEAWERKWGRARITVHPPEPS